MSIVAPYLRGVDIGGVFCDSWALGRACATFTSVASLLTGRPFTSARLGVSRPQLDWFAVWRVAVGIGPGLFAGEQGGGIGQAFGCDKALEGGEPMVVVMSAIVGIAAVGCGLEFGGERGRPFFPREMALLGEFDGEREGLRLPRLGEDGTVGVARQGGQGFQKFGFGNRIRLAQGSYPIDRCKRSRAAPLARPIIRAR